MGDGVVDGRGLAVVDSKRMILFSCGWGVWNGLGVVEGRVDELRKRRWMGFDVVDDDDAQHGVMSLGWTFKLVNAERRCSEWGGSIFLAFGGKALWGSGLEELKVHTRR